MAFTRPGAYRTDSMSDFSKSAGSISVRKNVASPFMSSMTIATSSRQAGRLNPSFDRRRFSAGDSTPLAELKYMTNLAFEGT